MTRVLLMSDLHLEDLDPGSWDPGIVQDFDVLACAGDVVEGDPEGSVDVLARIAAGRPCVYVPGNHDVWGRSIEEAVAAALSRNPAVHVLDGETVRIGGLSFVGGTLWDDPDDWPAGIPRVKATDATLSGEPVHVGVGAARRQATLADLGRIHERTIGAIGASDAPVVLTHYPPSTADMDRVARPVTWLHGHRHSVLVDRHGPHRRVRMPCARGIDLQGALLEFSGDGRLLGVTPLVGLRKGSPQAPR